MTKTIVLWTKNWLIKKNIPFYFLNQAGSSNDLAKEQAFQNSTPFAIFLVNHQSHGRGRGNAKWEDSDLMISFFWEGHLKKISVSSCRDFVGDLKMALETVWPELPLQIKAPNDLYIGTKKTAGILLELLNQGSQTALIVGLGLNVLSYPKHLPAACLMEHTNNININTWPFFLEKLFFLWNQRASFLWGQKHPAGRFQ